MPVWMDLFELHMAERMDSTAISGGSEESVELSEKDKISFFLDHLSAYVLGCEDKVPKIKAQHSDFTESIGKAVELYMSQLSQTYHSDELWFLVFLDDDIRVKHCVRKMSTCLRRFAPRHCFFFLAAVCELIRLSRILETWDIEEDVKRTAAYGMAMFLPWCDDRIFEKLDASAIELLAQGNINPMLIDP